jgi:predicted RNase H-like HicB family nuclease
MITAYLEQALARAKYASLDDGSYCATVPGLRGVVAIGAGVEACRRELAEVVEAWVLVRVAGGLRIRTLGGVTIRVRRTG